MSSALFVCFSGVAVFDQQFRRFQTDCHRTTWRPKPCDANRHRVVAIASLGASGIHTVGLSFFGWLIHFLRTSCCSWPSLAADKAVHGLPVVRDDTKFLRHVQWPLAGSGGLESGWSSVVCHWLALGLGCPSYRVAANSRMEA